MIARRSLLRALAMGFVTLAVVVVPAIADELRGFITKVDVSAKKVTVTEKGGTETVITTTDDTEWVTKKETRKINLEKLEKQVKKNLDAGKKGIAVKVTHEKGVASSISTVRKKAAN